MRDGEISMLRQRKERPRSNKRESFSPRQRPVEEIVLRLPLEHHYSEPGSTDSPATSVVPPSAPRGRVDVDFYI